MYISKINDHLRILSNEEVKDSLVIIREKKNLKKVAKSLYIFLTTPDELENVYIVNLFDLELQPIKNKPVIKSKFSRLKKFKVHTMLLLD